MSQITEGLHDEDYKRWALSETINDPDYPDLIGKTNELRFVIKHGPSGQPWAGVWAALFAAGDDAGTARPAITLTLPMLHELRQDVNDMISDIERRVAAAEMAGPEEEVTP